MPYWRGQRARKIWRRRCLRLHRRICTESRTPPSAHATACATLGGPRVTVRVRASSARHALQWIVASSSALKCSSTAESRGEHASAAASLDWLAQRCSSNRSCCRSSCCCSSCARWLTRSRSMRAGRTSTILVSTHVLTRPHDLGPTLSLAHTHVHARMHTGRHARVHTRALAHTNTPAHALSLDALTRSKRCCVRIRRCA